MTNKIATKCPVKKYQDIDFGDFTALDYKAFGRRRSIIICTLGDPNITVQDIQTMMKAGMNVARFLTSHSTAQEKIKLIAKVDKAAKILASKSGILKWPCATCIELKTCLVSTGLLEKDRPFVTLKEKSKVILNHDVAEFNKCNESRIFVDNPYIITDTKVGMEISIKQDNIILKVVEILEDTIICIVVKEGDLRSMDTVCMTGATRSRPYITKKDLKLVKLAVEYQVDMMIVNYSRHPETLRQIKKYIGPNLKRPYIISGICTYEGLCNLDDIIKETDGILLSRELLAYEIDRKLFYRMGQIQKLITGKCRQAGKPLFISGQVFEKTLTSGKLDTVDISDVTNSILEGASGFIIDNWPDISILKHVIATMSDVCAEIEPLTNNEVDFERNLLGMHMPLNAAMATAVCSVLLANQCLSPVIVNPTVSGTTIYYLNSMQPSCTIIAVTTNVKTFRLLQGFRSVLPLYCPGATNLTWYKTMMRRVAFGVNYALDNGFLGYNENYVTLEKGSEESSYCDTVKCFKVLSKKRHDFKCYDPHNLDDI